MTRTSLVLLVVVLAGAVAGGLSAQQRGKPRRAEAPTFRDSGAFFPDIFQQFEGERPASGAGGTRPSGGQPTPGGAPTPSPEPGGGGGLYAWKSLISPTTLEDEIKGMKLAVDQTVTTPTDFRGKGYIEARTQFTMIAVMLGIISEYDDDVRWKDKAAGARDLFARSAANCKVGTVQAYNEAKIRKEDLQLLLSGGALDLPPAEAKSDWSQVCDRNPLMKRLRTAERDTLAPMLANQGEFKANMEKVLHEAETVAVIAEILRQEGMVDAAEQDYQEFCEQMKRGARQIADAVKLENYDSARAGLGEIRTACDLCHEGYR